MENLDKLTAAGLPVYDLNVENVDRTDWSSTTLGPRDKWPLTLQILINSVILPIPHCAAIFYGPEFCTIHNLAWEKAMGKTSQGAHAETIYGQEAYYALRAAVRGRTVKVACQYFLPETADYSPDTSIVLSTIIDEQGKRQGVLAQLMHNSVMERFLPMSDLNSMARQTKDHGAQQTKGKDAQSDARQTQLFSRFAELLPNGLAILDSNAEAVFVNDNFFKLTTRKSSDEFRAWPESIHPGDYERVMREYREAFYSRQELRTEFRCVEEGGSEGEWRLFLLKPLSDEIEAGFICAVVDITEIKQAQITQEKAAIGAQQRKEQQERFIDMVSHEIRNPLSAVLHLAEEIKDIARQLESNKGDVVDCAANILDAADTILLCVDHQNTLVDDILSFSKLDSMMLSLVPREVRLKWEFSKALKVFNSEFKAKNIDFHYAMDISYDDYGIDSVVADVNRLKQVLLNLLTNAIKFTARKQGSRKITVSMGASSERPTSYPPSVIFFSPDKNASQVDSTRSGDWGSGPELYIMVAVRDTGIGISPQNQKKLFERFGQATPKTQENYGGSGLGLFISRKLLQLHGGDIGVASKYGEGSTFGFFFKVRRITYDDGRPSFTNRSASDLAKNSERSQTPRPSYNRTRSALDNIKEEAKGRPKIETLTSHGGVDPDAVDNESLMNPPTELRAEAHPKAQFDERSRETQRVVDSMPGSNPTHSNLEEGETERQKNTAETRSQSHSEHGSKQDRTVLLVEDNLINQKVLRRQLQARGFEVFVASNGQEAIDAVKKRGEATPDSSINRNYFDCILMDQEMPIKDGNLATTEIREIQERGDAGRSPILGVSANVRKAQKDAMIEAGMDAVISKPFKVDALVEKMKGLMSK
ncbi:putative histidine kinase HHK12p [Dendryphion nanum]|uniref:Histidine kinase HHK12p n=1 Tax=Dendryphion nanum TaxID=256645 RepID=A0A9P9DDX0_9PLEO|nr:putative histidine kinase HHK12p [Dendryphion nanum]